MKAKKFTADPKASIEFLEGYYALLQSCRFNNVRGTNHKAKDHVCEPLANSSVRAIHFILTAAFKQGLKWGYVGTNVPAMADPPGFDQPEPDPPTPEELTPLMNEAFKSLDWGLFLWLTMITGSRRGEMCVLRWTDLNVERRRLHIKRAGDQLPGEVVETTTKRKQHHDVTLDDLTMELLESHRDQCVQQCKALGVELSPDAFIFSGSPDFSTALKPNTATQRYRRAAKRHKLRSTRLHSIRHYSATELLSAGVDIKTVQGRIGHTSAATTLKSTSPGPTEPTSRPPRSSPRQSPVRATRITSGRRTRTRRWPQPFSRILPPASTRSAPNCRCPETWLPCTRCQSALSVARSAS